MSLEERVLTLFAEGNPVPDLDDLERVDVEAAAYLAILEQRSSEMTQLDEKRQETKRPRRPNTTWLAAAVAVIVLGVAIFLLSQGNEEAPVVTEAPPVPSTVQETTTDPAGFWQLGTTRRLHLGDDGTYAWLVAGSVRDRGVWQQEADTIVLQSDSDSRACEAGESAIYQLEMPGGDALTLTFGSDDCSGERNIVPEGRSETLERTDLFEVPDPPSPEEAAWQSLPLLNAPAGELARLPTFQPEVAFDSEVPLVPGVGPGADDFAPLFLNSLNDQPVALVFIRLDGVSTAEQQANFTDTEKFEISESGDVTVGTAEGVRTRFTVLMQSSIPNSVQPFPLLSGEEYISYVLDVAGQTVLLLANVDVIDSDVFDDLATSIVWKDLR